MRAGRSTEEGEVVRSIPTPRKQRTPPHCGGGQIMREKTYAHLDKVLASLGFSVRMATVENKLRVYEHAEAGARLALAFLPDDDIVLPYPMAAVEGTLKV
jgi:hypothetical protein